MTLSDILYNEELESDFYQALYKIRKAFSKGCKNGSSSIQRLQPLSWPPPPASTRAVIPQEYFQAKKNLGQVYNQLRAAILKCNYKEFRLFGIEKGFAILTRLERIEKDGTPSNADRWGRGKQYPSSLSEYLSALLMGTEGNFRVIMFIVTPLTNFRDNGTPMLTAGKADQMYNEGGLVLPPEVANLPVGHYVHVLIYQFMKKNSGTVNMLRNQEQVIPAISQLEATQLIKNLGK